MTSRRSFAADAVDRYILIQFVHQRCCPGTIVGLSEVVLERVGERVCAGFGLVPLFVAAVSGKHVAQHGLAIDGLIERLRGARAVGMLVGVFLVIFRFFLRAFFLALPVAAKLVVDEGEGRQIGLAGVRIVLDDLLHLFFVHLIAEIGFLLLRGGTRGGIGLLQLPENVGGTVGSFGSQRRAGKHFDEAAIEVARALGGVDGAARVLSQRLLVGAFAHQDLVAVGRGFDDDAFGLHPAGDGRRCLFAAESRRVACVHFFNVSVGVDANPGAAFFGDDQFTADLNAVYFLGTGVGGDVEDGHGQRGGAWTGHGLYLRLFLGRYRQACAEKAERESGGAPDV